MDHYRLEGKKAVPCTLMEWAESIEKDRRVALDEIYGMRVSTVFIGLDHNFFGKGDPLLFETMIFVGQSGWDEDMMRYSTWEQAEAGHRSAVQSIRRNPWKYAALPWLQAIWRKLRRLFFEKAQVLCDVGNKVVRELRKIHKAARSELRSLIQRIKK